LSYVGKDISALSKAIIPKAHSNGKVIPDPSSSHSRDRIGAYSGGVYQDSM